MVLYIYAHQIHMASKIYFLAQFYVVSTTEKSLPVSRGYTTELKNYWRECTHQIASGLSGP